MALPLILKGIGAALSGYFVIVKSWVIIHQSDFAALIKRAETQYSDGVWTIEEKKQWKDEALNRFVYNNLPWYIPKFLVVGAINNFIEKVLFKAKEMKKEGV